MVVGKAKLPSVWYVMAIFTDDTDRHIAITDAIKKATEAPSGWDIQILIRKLTPAETAEKDRRAAM